VAYFEYISEYEWLDEMTFGSGCEAGSTRLVTESVSHAESPPPNQLYPLVLRTCLRCHQCSEVPLHTAAALSRRYISAAKSSNASSAEKNVIESRLLSFYCARFQPYRYIAAIVLALFIYFETYLKLLVITPSFAQKLHL